MEEKKQEFVEEIGLQEAPQENIQELLDEVSDPEDQRELTEEEKKEIYVQQLKESKNRFKSVVHKGNVTMNKFDKAAKNKRRKKNKAAKASRKRNRR